MVLRSSKVDIVFVDIIYLVSCIMLFDWLSIYVIIFMLFVKVKWRNLIIKV